MCDFFVGEKEKLLDRIRWTPSPNLPLHFIDCQTLASTAATFQDGLCHGSLDDSEVSSWLAQKGRFQASRTCSTNVTASQGLRLLLFDVGNRRMPRLCVGKDSFIKIEAELSLHPATIPCMFRKGGLSFAFKDINPISGDVDRLSIIIRSPHSGDAGNRFLSMTHDFKTRLTTAIMLGDADPDIASSDIGYRLNLEQLLTLIRSTPDVWDHPTFLATSMLYSRVEFFHGYARVIIDNFGELERAVGVTRAGHMGTAPMSDMLDDWPESVNVKVVTVQIHTLAKRVILLEDVTRWQHRCADCLIDIETWLEERFRSDMMFRSQSQKLHDVLKYISSTSDGMETAVRSMQQRVQMQINVLASVASQQDNLISREQNVIAQKSNRLSIRIATSTKKDSIAMMAFTFITALFLPGTYIASLFSMGMFNWQASASAAMEPNTVSSDQEAGMAVVSSRFWIYWAVSAPLTGVVMLGWFVWYRIADVAWRKETGLAKMGRIEGGGGGGRGDDGGNNDGEKSRLGQYATA